MDVDKIPISLSQFAELLGIDPTRFLSVVRVSGTRLEIWLTPKPTKDAA